MIAVMRRAFGRRSPYPARAPGRSLPHGTLVRDTLEGRQRIERELERFWNHPTFRPFAR